ncbi:hypothetical protein LSPCS325_39960 [Lysinibacillus sp. CTST325]
MEHYVKDSHEYENKNIFGDCEQTLNQLAENRIFNILYVEEKGIFNIYEMCDEYFGTNLTVGMCEDLSELFIKIGNKLKENNSTK